MLAPLDRLAVQNVQIVQPSSLCTLCMSVEPLPPHRNEEEIDLLALSGVVLVAEEAPEEGRL